MNILANQFICSVTYTLLSLIFSAHAINERALDFSQIDAPFVLCLTSENGSESKKAILVERHFDPKMKRSVRGFLNFVQTSPIDTVRLDFHVASREQAQQFFGLFPMTTRNRLKMGICTYSFSRANPYMSYPSYCDIKSVDELKHNNFRLAEACNASFESLLPLFFNDLFSAPSPQLPANATRRLNEIAATLNQPGSTSNGLPGNLQTRRYTNFNLSVTRITSLVPPRGLRASGYYALYAALALQKALQEARGPHGTFNSDSFGRKLSEITANSFNRNDFGNFVTEALIVLYQLASQPPLKHRYPIGNEILVKNDSIEMGITTDLSLPTLSFLTYLMNSQIKVWNTSLREEIASFIRNTTAQPTFQTQTGIALVDTNNPSISRHWVAFSLISLPKSIGTDPRPHEWRIIIVDPLNTINVQNIEHIVQEYETATLKQLAENMANILPEQRETKFSTELGMFSEQQKNLLENLIKKAEATQQRRWSESQWEQWAAERIAAGLTKISGMTVEQGEVRDQINQLTNAEKQYWVERLKAAPLVTDEWIKHEISLLPVGEKDDVINLLKSVHISLGQEIKFQPGQRPRRRR